VIIYSVFLKAKKPQIKGPKIKSRGITKKGIIKTVKNRGAPIERVGRAKEKRKKAKKKIPKIETAMPRPKIKGLKFGLPCHKTRSSKLK
jgi:hypothetical protein